MLPEVVGHEFVGVEVDVATDVVVADAPFVAEDGALFVECCAHVVVELFAAVVAAAVAVVVVAVAFVG